MSLNRNPARHLTPAEAALLSSSLVNPTAATPGKNATDGGASSKPNVNPQQFNNESLRKQNFQQNIAPTVAQYQAAAVHGANKKITAEAQADYQRARTVAEVLHANGQGPATAALAAKTPLEMKKINHDIATGSVQSMGSNPDLGALAAEKQMYS